MEKFRADYYYGVGNILGQIRADVQNNLENGISVETRKVLHESLVHLITDLKKVGLSISVKAAEAVRNSVKDDDRFIPQNFVAALTQLDKTIEWEMEEVRFFHMPSSRSQFYDQKELFGAVVNVKFLSTQFDMVEAGNCYAMGRGTACVFHLMRIMEVGVQQLGTKLGVTFTDQKNWQPILDETNKAIKTLPPKDPATVELCQVAANLYSVKVAWRNEVMHPNDMYTLEEAENLIRQVKLFMGQLANIV
jgi:hypothetical protein